MKRAEALNTEAMNGVEEVPEEGEIDSNAAAPNKVHIRGLDRLNTYDIERYASEHYSSDLFQKVQWVDDTSANLIYDTPTAAAEALAAFSVDEVSDQLQLRLAKPLSTHPDVELQVRLAIVADVKVKGAKEHSRFYLMNPRWDPDNPKNERPGVKRRRPDDGDGHNKYRKRDYELDRRDRRGSRGPQQEFHEDMYGDDPKAPTDSRRSSHSGNEDRPRRNRSEDLFASRQHGRLRNRSASPSRDEDGRYGFNDTQPYRQTARARSRTPPNIRNRDNRNSRDKLRKELFPNHASSTALSNGASNNHSRQSSSNSNKELFPERVGSPSHRRQDAKDIGADEVTKAIGQCNINSNRVKLGNSFTYSNSGRRPEQNERNKNQGRDLFSRIQGGPGEESTYGRLNSDGDSGGFNIRGAGDAGFSILGASKERVQSPLVKELFPLKASAKPDLFDGRIKGRAGRRRAEEYF
jgi:hypothetical protein